MVGQTFVARFFFVVFTTFWQSIPAMCMFAINYSDLQRKEIWIEIGEWNKKIFSSLAICLFWFPQWCWMLMLTGGDISNRCYLYMHIYYICLFAMHRLRFNASDDTAQTKRSTFHVIIEIRPKTKCKNRAICFALFCRQQRINDIFYKRFCFKCHVRNMKAGGLPWINYIHLLFVRLFGEFRLRFFFLSIILTSEQ